MCSLRRVFEKGRQPVGFILIVTGDDELASTLIHTLSGRKMAGKTYFALAVSGCKDALAVNGTLKLDLFVLDESLSISEGSVLYTSLSDGILLNAIPSITLGTQPTQAERKQALKRSVSLPKSSDRNELLALARQLLTESQRKVDASL